jgi:hypothetical protein
MTPVDFKRGLSKKADELEEVFARWFEFGVNKKTGHVDIATSQFGDVITDVPPKIAEQILAERQRFIDAMYALINPIPVSVPRWAPEKGLNLRDVFTVDGLSHRYIVARIRDDDEPSINNLSLVAQPIIAADIARANREMGD